MILHTIGVGTNGDRLVGTTAEKRFGGRPVGKYHCGEGGWTNDGRLWVGSDCGGDLCVTL